ncbi:MAG: HAD family hydrolase [Firmicutes bacterium]|nr:HAD family hydrolase [Bacillota bacterium]
MQAKLVVFDVDGTLLNTFAGIKYAIDGMRAHFGLCPSTDQQVRQCIGLDMDRFVQALVPERSLSANELEQYKQVRKECYQNNPNPDTMPYDGMVELLHKLQRQGVRLAILTNKTHQGALENCKQFFDGINFEIIKGNRSGFCPKPAPDELLDICDTLGVNKKHAIFVGDSELDVLCAQNAGVRCLAVLWGFRDKKDLLPYGATEFAETALELYQKIVL